MKQPSFARACLWPVGDYETSDWLLPPGRPTCPESASLRASTLPLLSRQRRPAALRCGRLGSEAEAGESRLAGPQELAAGFGADLSTANIKRAPGSPTQ